MRICNFFHGPTRFHARKTVGTAWFRFMVWWPLRLDQRPPRRWASSSYNISSMWVMVFSGILLSTSVIHLYRMVVGIYRYTRTTGNHKSGILGLQRYVWSFACPAPSRQHQQSLSRVLCIVHQFFLEMVEYYCFDTVHYPIKYYELDWKYHIPEDSVIASYSHAIIKLPFDIQIEIFSPSWSARI